MSVKKYIHDKIQILKNKSIVFYKFMIPILVIFGFSIFLSYLTIYKLAEDVSTIIDKTVTNFGAIGIPILLIWIQYTYNKIKEQERKQKEQEYEYQQRQKEKTRALESLKSGDTPITYGFKKIFQDVAQAIFDYCDPVHQARENGASEEEIQLAEKERKKCSPQNIIESKLDTE